MTSFFRDAALILSLAATLVLSGCWGGPQAVKVPPLEPELVANAVMDQYDSNGDAKLTADELTASPALAASAKRLDKDKNQNLSKEELVARFAMWVEGGVGVSPFGCRVTKGGKPLTGATVKFVPEAFFGGVIQPAEGTTNKTGTAQLSIDKSHLPRDLQNLRAIHQGIYRVEITHPSEHIPAKYNTESTLGLIVSFETGSTFIPFKL